MAANTGLARGIASGLTNLGQALAQKRKQEQFQSDLQRIMQVVQPEKERQADKRTNALSDQQPAQLGTQLMEAMGQMQTAEGQKIAADLLSQQIENRMQAAEPEFFDTPHELQVDGTVRPFVEKRTYRRAVQQGAKPVPEKEDEREIVVHKRVGNKLLEHTIPESRREQAKKQGWQVGEITERIEPAGEDKPTPTKSYITNVRTGAKMGGKPGTAKYQEMQQLLNKEDSDWRSGQINIDRRLDEARQQIDKNYGKQTDSGIVIDPEKRAAANFAKVQASQLIRQGRPVSKAVSEATKLGDRFRKAEANIAPYSQAFSDSMFSDTRRTPRFNKTKQGIRQMLDLGISTSDIVDKLQNEYDWNRDDAIMAIKEAANAGGK